MTLRGADYQNDIHLAITPGASDGIRFGPSSLALLVLRNYSARAAGAFSLVGLASPVTDLSWLAPVGLAAAVWTVVLVARAVVRDRVRRADHDAIAPAELKQAA